MKINLQLILLNDIDKDIDITKYRLIIGALNYAAVLTRPDIVIAVNYLAKFM